MFSPFESLKPARISPVAAAFASVAQAVRMIGMVGAAWSNRRRLSQISALDDRMLADLGLARGDVAAAASGPLWSDPTTRLSVFAVERRAAARDYARWRRAKGAEISALEPRGARPSKRRTASIPCDG